MPRARPTGRAARRRPRSRATPGPWIPRPSPIRRSSPTSPPPERATIRRRAAFLLALAVTLGTIPAGVARAGAQLDAAVQALGSSPIYSAPGAQLGLSSAERGRVERAIAQDQPGPFYVAVLPDSARA